MKPTSIANPTIAMPSQNAPMSPKVCRAAPPARQMLSAVPIIAIITFVSIGLVTRVTVKIVTVTWIAAPKIDVSAINAGMAWLRQR